MTRTPGITTIREITLSSINGMLARIRERFDSIDARLAQVPASAAAFASLELQVKNLQASAGRTTTVVQNAPTEPTEATPAGIPEVDADPAAPGAGEAWVLRTLESAAGTLLGFAGGFPLIQANDVNRFDLSIATSEGAKRVQIT